MKKIFMISIMVFMSVAMFGQDLRKIAKETIMEKLFFRFMTIGKTKELTIDFGF